MPSSHWPRELRAASAWASGNSGAVHVANYPLLDVGTDEITSWNSFFHGLDSGPQTGGATACDEKMRMVSVRKADRALTEADVKLVGDVNRAGQRPIWAPR